jgi:hypothetical protein
MVGLNGLPPVEGGPLTGHEFGWFTGVRDGVGITAGQCGPGTSGQHPWRRRAAMRWLFVCVGCQ